MDLKALVEASWSARGTVSTFFDPRRCDVSVPPHCRVHAGLRLDWPLNGSPPIGDLTIDHYGIRGTLAFGGKLWPCLVPWAAVTHIIGADGNVTPVTHDEPPTVVFVRTLTVIEGGGQTTPARKPALRVIEGGRTPKPPEHDGAA